MKGQERKGREERIRFAADSDKGNGEEAWFRCNQYLHFVVTPKRREGGTSTKPVRHDTAGE
jgi:hypothetical protein